MEISSNHTTRGSVLIVEDDLVLAKLVSDYLTKHGFDVSHIARGDLVIDYVVRELPDIVILDLMLPGMHGVEVCQQLRLRYKGPVIMLTALGETNDQILGLEIGADDYLTKPVEPRVLLARIRALTRRIEAADLQQQKEKTIVEIPAKSIRIELSSRSLIVEGMIKELTTAEFDLLWLLASQAGTVVSRDDIYLQLKGMPFDGVDRSIDLRISTLRKLMNDSKAKPAVIKTVRGKGYLFMAPTAVSVT